MKAIWMQGVFGCIMAHDSEQLYAAVAISYCVYHLTH